MKKFASLLVVLICVSSIALAEIDLSGMSFDDLVQLRQEVDLAIFNSDGWQEVEVPAGIYLVGQDIPEGKWTIRPVDGYTASITCASSLSSNKIELEDNFYYDQITSENDSYAKYNSVRENILDLVSGTYIRIENANVIFTPFAGNSLGFK